ncbi:MAG: NUDIX hydrolase [Candidatus Eremiobacteraeota bacterium]|nr:NUDIX hydrolase [Candidatus Eremiobacteraeota bacterium]
MDQKWRVLSSAYVVDSKWMRLRKDTLELRNGVVIDEYYVRETGGFSCVFALTDDSHVVLVRQFKYGIGRTVLELPSGFIDDGESPHDAAVRELAEETGYVADSIEPVRTLVPDPTNSTTLMHLFLARGARRKLAQHLDPTEDIEIETVSLPELHEKVRNGEIESATQVAAIYMVLDMLA